MKNNEVMTLNDYQRQTIIGEIREIFVHFNGGQPANEFIEKMWQTMSPQNLYKALGNFTRMAENEEWVIYTASSTPVLLTRAALCQSANCHKGACGFPKTVPYYMYEKRNLLRKHFLRTSYDYLLSHFHW